MKLANLIDQLAEISSRQWGMFTTSQAKAIGVTPQQLARLANLGRTARVRHGIYLMESTRADRFTQLRAAWLAMEPTMTVADRLAMEDPGIFCGRSAAYLHGLGNASPSDLELAFGTRKQSRQRDVTYRLRKYTPRDWSLVGGVPTTKPLVTIRDHATGRVDDDVMLDLLRAAQVHNRINASKLKSIADTYAKYYGYPNGSDFLLAARNFEGELADVAFRQSSIAARESGAPAKEYGNSPTGRPGESPKPEISKGTRTAPPGAIVPQPLAAPRVGSTGRDPDAHIADAARLASASRHSGPPVGHNVAPAGGAPVSDPQPVKGQERFLASQNHEAPAVGETVNPAGDELQVLAAVGAQRAALGSTDTEVVSAAPALQAQPVAQPVAQPEAVVQVEPASAAVFPEDASDEAFNDTVPVAVKPVSSAAPEPVVTHFTMPIDPRLPAGTPVDVNAQVQAAPVQAAPVQPAQSGAAPQGTQPQPVGTSASADVEGDDTTVNKLRNFFGFGRKK